MAHQMDIRNGPSKFDLMVSLIHGDHSHRISVVFHVGNIPLVYKNSIFLWDVVINYLEREEGDGINWGFSGYHITLGGEWKPVEGIYNLNKRTGSIWYT